MEHRQLPNSELKLPVVTFGAWAIGGLFWGGTDDDDAIASIHAAMDHGIDAIDTAPMYGCGHSETVIARAIKGKRDKVLILDKCGLRWDDTSGSFYFTIKAPDGSKVDAYKNVKAESITHECEQSLERLGIDTIDLYQVHWPSDTAPAEETMSALVRLNEEGKIREIGVTNYMREDLAESVKFGPIVSDQIRYNLLQREVETDPIPYCRQNNIGVICYSPMSLGLLTGKVTMDRKFVDTDVRSILPWFKPANRQRVLETLEEIRPIAQSHSATLAQLSVAWLLAQEGVTTALIGARNAKQAAENAGAGDIKLGLGELDAIRKVFEDLGPPVDE
ncbi:MAG: aldo/keto reductase [Planctomycetota bacterium]|jgi:aryl-alcohol dehydrogenase-like predicted oxidoreductase